MHKKSRLHTTLLVVAFVLSGAIFAGAQSPLTSGFAGTNSFDGNCFDLKAIAGGVAIQNFDIHLAGTSDVLVYALTAPNVSYLGNQNIAANWTLLATETGVVGNGLGFSTPLNLTLNYPINAGEIQAFCVTTTNQAASFHYTTGTVVGALFASNLDLELYEGHGGAHPFAYNNAARAFNGNIYYTSLAMNNVDLQCSSIDAPDFGSTSCLPTLGAAENITVTIRNLGQLPWDVSDFFDLTVDLDSVNVLSESFNPSATPFLGTEQYTSISTVDLSALGAHTLDVHTTVNLSVSGFTDADLTNDTCSVSYMSPGGGNPVGFGYSENFDSLGGGFTVPAGWQNAQDDLGTISGYANGDWRNIIGTTPSTNASPDNDHTQGPGGQGVYMYIEDSGSSAGNFIELRSPCLDTSGATGVPRVNFWVANNGGQGGTTANDYFVDVIDLTTGMTTLMVIPNIGGFGDILWHELGVDLSAFAGNIVQIQFRVDPNNAAFNSDCALDDFFFFDAVLGTGQAPRPGVSVFDINNSKNGAGDAVVIGGPGPYATDVTLGGDMNMTWEGAPANSIICWFGPLLEAAASFAPPIGQFDTGDGTLNMFGIPNGLSGVGDGNAAILGTGTLFDSVFFTGIGGTGGASVTVPDFFPPGTLGTFQMAVQDFGVGVLSTRISNAVTVTLVP